MEILQQLYTSMAVFKTGTDCHDYKLDGQQSVKLACMLGFKILTLTETVGSTHSILTVYPVLFTSIALGMTASCWKSVPEGKREELAKDSLKWQWINFSGERLYHTLQQGDQFINTALAVYYIAQLSLFGLQAGPALGLLSLSLLAVKQLGYLPASIDRALRLAFPWADLVYNLCSDRTISIKLILIIVDLMAITSNPALRFGEAPDYLPGSHTFKEVTALPDTLPPFEVNRTYVYSDKISSILPPLDVVEEPQKVAKELMSAIEQAYTSFTPEQQDGWKALKSGVCDSIFQGRGPYNTEFFNQLMCSVLKSILADKDFETKVCDLAEVGNHCSANWTSEIYFFYAPQSKDDIAWSVHLELAKWRGHCLEDNIRTCFKDTLVGLAAGGSNNVHLMERFHTIARHRIRTYQGEIAHKLNHPSSLECLFWKSVLNSNQNRVGLGEDLRFGGQFVEEMYAGLDGSSLFLLATVSATEEMLFKSLDEHVNQIFLAIKPAEPEVNDIRTIPWEPVLLWIGRFTEKVGVDDQTFMDKYTLKTNYGQDYLTKEGVKLLLWDLGILKKKLGAG